MLQRLALTLAVAGSFFACRAARPQSSESLSVTEKGFAYREIKVTVQTSDGQPAKGIGISYMFWGKRFYWRDPNVINGGLAPGVYSTLDKKGLLGTTGDDGIFVARDVKIEGIDELDNRPSQLDILIDNGGGSSDLCPDGQKRAYVAWGSSYIVPATTTSNGVRANCQRIVSARDVNDPDSFELTCMIDRTLDSYEAIRAEAINRDCR